MTLLLQQNTYCMTFLMKHSKYFMDMTLLLQQNTHCMTWLMKHSLLLDANHDTKSLSLCIVVVRYV